MPPPSVPSFGEDSYSGGKSSSATSCGASPSALLYKISEPACRLWFFLTGRSTRATSFLFFLPLCNARPSVSSDAIVGHDGDHPQITVRRLGCRRLLDKSGWMRELSTDCWCKIAITPITNPCNAKSPKELRVPRERLLRYATWLEYQECRP
jgi:hypothetical protein